MYKDTIAAISTPVGEGGIGIVRLSGPKARAIAEKLFDHTLSDHRLVYGHIVDPKSGDVVDEVLVSYMKAPNTYTREDVVEINSHGGAMPLQRVLELVLTAGARLANPGEYTLRAFLNGRIDLAQAESVLDVIKAKTEASLRLAVSGLKGRLSGELKAVRSELISVLAYLTARIDFPEDEVEAQDVQPPLEQCRERLGDLIASADTGIAYRQGVRTAIVGRPNVGKSSLLNLLLREDRAIVTEVPGTTRDTVEEVVNIKGVPFVLIDTAGIAFSKDVVESLGIVRSRQAIEMADFVLLVIDQSEKLMHYDREIMELLEGKTVLVVGNKSDLPPKDVIKDIAWPVVSVSALSGKGLHVLEGSMVEAVLGGKVISSDAALVTNPRHKALLTNAYDNLVQAQKSIKGGMPEDFISIDVTAALTTLGQITGDTVTEELLETIFSQFCIGK
ncbi:MAG: tRNA uridine-5-carboxymethylaminomethyl(34) synthesis GTPase MnmE [Chloroflexi bacterium]|jgi:tRNA modification GTPase|nr:tRNA uridine-5-carboxymethylaminomethyl(34) synthesis GTPase MnmE [Chloroflexota bacterium]MBT7082186.1 tRNA uridine-5-carboxymethylaminomethyl(34) synthesis GTPase MnmE [Chloroflexota bacterium]MBT7289919.1 tRNA uridine-5-carboxymethylaminomethyl(34) synthesis GTPase MnmE [Chloroflexota bacterium]